MLADGERCSHWGVHSAVFSCVVLQLFAFFSKVYSIMRATRPAITSSRDTLQTKVPEVSPLDLIIYSRVETSEMGGHCIGMLSDVSKHAFWKFQCGKWHCGRPTPQWVDCICHLSGNTPAPSRSSWEGQGGAIYLATRHTNLMPDNRYVDNCTV